MLTSPGPGWELDHRSQPHRATVWGLPPTALHDAYWSSFGVQCVRRAESAAIERAADLYLLLEPDQSVVFDLASMIERLVWHGAPLTRVKLMPGTPTEYDERIICDDRGLVQRIERCYGSKRKPSRLAFITDRIHIAERWRDAQSQRQGHVAVRHAARGRIDRIRTIGNSFPSAPKGLDAPDPNRGSELLDALVATWRNPGCAIDNLEQISPGVWKLRRDIDCDPTGLIGPLWLGCGRVPVERTCIVGPAWLSDDPAALHATTRVEGRQPARIRSMIDIEMSDRPHRTRPPRPESFYTMAKRCIDITASAAVLTLLSPLFVLIALAILIDDGRPVLFRHRRQTLGGREFSCLKFRTMQRDAEQAVPSLATMNLCDGPQVFIRDDPRATHVGRWLRKAHLDELPQFWNVLIGDMSLVGPRPSPDRENQYCPAWRELRLSVRPGITGLWQLNRTRRPGQDFQEWIRYDVEYVRSADLWLDFRILLKTALVVARGRRDEREQGT